MNIHQLHWLIIVAYLSPKTWAIDQEFPSPAGPGINYQGLSLAKVLSDIEDNSNESSSNNAEEADNSESNEKTNTTAKSIEAESKGNAVTSSLIKDLLNVQEPDVKALINGTEDTPISKPNGENDLEIIKDPKELISHNDEPSLKILEKRETENGVVEVLGQNKSEILPIKKDVNQKLDYFPNEFCESQNINGKGTTIIQETMEQEDEEKARRFRGLIDEPDNRIDKNLIPSESSGLFNKRTGLSNKVKSKSEACDDSKMENVIPEIHSGNYMSCERDEEENAKKLQGMLGVVDSVMAAVNSDMRKDLGLCKKGKISDIANVFGNDEEKLKRVMNMITSCVRDVLKDQLTMKCCVPLPRELHSFLVWILHGSEGGKICPPTMHDQRCKPSYLFHEDNHRPHFAVGDSQMLLGAHSSAIVSSNKGRPGVGQTQADGATVVQQEQVPPREKEIIPKLTNHYDFDTSFTENNPSNILKEVYPQEIISNIRDNQFQKKNPISHNTYLRPLRSIPNTNYKAMDSDSPKINDGNIELMTYSEGIGPLFPNGFEFQGASRRIYDLTEEEIHPSSCLVEDNSGKKISKRELSKKHQGSKSKELGDSCEGMKVYSPRNRESTSSYLSQKSPEIYDEITDPTEMIIDVNELLNPILPEDRKIYSKHKKEKHKEKKKSKVSVHKDSQSNEHVIKYSNNDGKTDSVFRPNSPTNTKENTNSIDAKSELDSAVIKSISAEANKDLEGGLRETFLEITAPKPNFQLSGNCTRETQDYNLNDENALTAKEFKIKPKKRKNNKAIFNLENKKYSERMRATTGEPVFHMATIHMNLSDLIPQIEVQSVSPLKYGKMNKKNSMNKTGKTSFNKGKKLLATKIKNYEKELDTKSGECYSPNDGDYDAKDKIESFDEQYLGEEYIPFDPHHTLSEYYIRHMEDNKKGGRKLPIVDATSNLFSKKEKYKHRAKDKSSGKSFHKGKNNERANNMSKSVTKASVKTSITTTALSIVVATTAVVSTPTYVASTNKMITETLKGLNNQNMTPNITSSNEVKQEGLTILKGIDKVNKLVENAVSLRPLANIETSTRYATMVREKVVNIIIKNKTVESLLNGANSALSQSKLNNTFSRTESNTVKVATTSFSVVEKTTAQYKQDVSPASYFQEISKQDKPVDHKDKSENDKIKNETLEALEKLKKFDSNLKDKKESIRKDIIAKGLKRSNGNIVQAAVDDIISQLLKEDEGSNDEIISKKSFDEEDEPEEGKLTENDDDVERDQKMLNVWKNYKARDHDDDDEEDEEEDDDDDLIIEGKCNGSLISKVVKMSDPKHSNIITQYQAPKLLDDEISFEVENAASEHSGKKGYGKKTLAESSGGLDIDIIDDEPAVDLNILDTSTSPSEEVTISNNNSSNEERDDEDEPDEEQKDDLNKSE